MKKYYVSGDILKLDEDQSVEFKGHRTIAVENMPNQTKAEYSINGRLSRGKSRAPISRSICAMLNSTGGTIFMGVVDNGTVHGIPLTQNQQNHVLLEIYDTLQRFRPSVPTERYQVSFIPVLDSDMDESCLLLPVANKEVEKKKHAVRTARYCWCDLDAKTKQDLGIFPRKFVIKVDIKPHRKADSNTSIVDGVAPVFEDEVGQAWIRSTASCVKYTPRKVALDAYEKSRSYVDRIMDELRRDIVELEQNVSDTGVSDLDDASGSSY